VVLGIPDFRVFPDPYIGLAEDREKAARLAEQARRTDFRGLLEHYWAITPGTPPDLARRYVRHALAAADRGRHLLGELPAGPARLLEIGCGTGGLLLGWLDCPGHLQGDWGGERQPRPPIAPPGAVGVDIALRWLVVARKRLEEANRTVPLVCACAEALPFRERAFDLVVANDVLEHVASPKRTLREAHRVLRPGGHFFAATPNRLALRPDPHVRLWGVGWLPRRWRETYVSWRRGVPYRHVRLLSGFELARLGRHSPFGHCQLTLPTFSLEELAGLPAGERWLTGVYHRLRTWPVCRQLFFVLGPAFHAECVRE
jgi:SAM-dependent methyltransferase